MAGRIKVETASHDVRKVEHSLGGSRTLFQKQLAGVFGAWVSGLERLAVEAGVPRKRARERAEDAVLTIEGALVLSGASAIRRRSGGPSSGSRATFSG